MGRRKWLKGSDAQQVSAVNTAEAENAIRIVEAYTVMQAWQTQPRIDIITDADKASLTVWMKYMQAVDTAAPDII